MRLIRAVVIVALVYLSVSAFVGGIQLIVNAHGNPWGIMPESLLRYSPFHSYLIPGLLLLTANGLLALWVLFLALVRRPHYGLWTAIQGLVLLGWLTVECLMLKIVIWPHYLYGALALVLIVSGLTLRNEVGADVRR